MGENVLGCSQKQHRLLYYYSIKMYSLAPRLCLAKECFHLPSKGNSKLFSQRTASICLSSINPYHNIEPVHQHIPQKKNKASSLTRYRQILLTYYLPLVCPQEIHCSLGHHICRLFFHCPDSQGCN